MEEDVGSRRLMLQIGIHLGTKSILLLVHRIPWSRGNLHDLELNLCLPSGLQSREPLEERQIDEVRMEVCKFIPEIRDFIPAIRALCEKESAPTHRATVT
ncbi:hypothetical protein L1887_18922 [Cichorium endivia]|nr:hypothetical protein L1887_18922 [Cichorium endivia]